MTDQRIFLEQQSFEKKQREAQTALSILYAFSVQKGDILCWAVEHILEELSIGDVIPLMQYGKLANYLIAVRNLLDNPSIIDTCKTLMLSNLKIATQKEEGLLKSLTFHDSFRFWEEQQTNEYNDFIAEMTSAILNNVLSVSHIDEPLEYVKGISEMMSNNNNSIFRTNEFMGKMDISKIIAGLEKASAEQISDFKHGFFLIYQRPDILNLLPHDRGALVELREGVKTLVDNEKNQDKIVQLQYKWLLQNIETGISNYKEY